MSYMARLAAPISVEEFDIRVAYIPLDDKTRAWAGREELEVYCVAFPPTLKKLGKSFWQHTGMGVTSRYAESCLSNIDGPGVRIESVKAGPYEVCFCQRSIPGRF